MPVQGCGGSGGANLRVPTGGLEKGTPRKTWTVMFPTCVCFPCRMPCLVTTRGSLVYKAPGKRRGTVILVSHRCDSSIAAMGPILPSLPPPSFFLLFIHLSPESHYMTQVGFKPITLLPQSPKCWDYRSVLPDLGSCCCCYIYKSNQSIIIIQIFKNPMLVFCVHVHLCTTCRTGHWVL